MKTHHLRRFAPALSLTLCLPFALLAQTTPPTTPTTTTPEGEEETTLLSPFVVNTDKDNGYIAVDSLAGGRTNTPIKLTPASISSLTRTFIDDLAIQNVREALRWTPNVVATDQNAGKGFGGAAFQDWSFNFRSAGAGQQGGPGPTRNYFSFFQNPDTYNIERLEVLRGPNGLVFGLGTVGGTLSTYTKVPRFDKNATALTTILDTEGSLRFELDHNMRVSDKMAVRFNGLHDHNEGWRQGDVNKMDALDLAVLYKLGDQTSLRVEIEDAHKERTLISTTIADKSSGWDGVTASQTWGATPTGGNSRVDPIQNAGAWGDWLQPFYIYTPSLGAKALLPWAGGFASTSTLSDKGVALPWQPKAGWYPAQIKLPWEATFSSTANIPVTPSRDWTYGHGVSETNYSNLSAFLDHRFSKNLDASVSFYRYYDDQFAKDYEGTGGAAVDINKQLPDGTANPNFGKQFADFFLSKQTQERSVTEFRGQVNYQFEATLFGAPWKQRFSAYAADKTTRISARQFLGQVGNGTTIGNPADWVFNMVWGRIYLDQPNQILNPPDVAPNGRQITYAPKADGFWFDFDEKFQSQEYAVLSHTQLLDDRLSILAGVRRDTYDRDVRELRKGPNLTDNIIAESDHGTSYSAGAVYYVTQWLGLFGNYSENILPPPAGSRAFINGDRPGPETGTGYDYGIRVSTDDGKYYASFSRYDTKSQNHLVENPIALRGVWQKFNQVQGLNTDSGLGSLAYSDTTARDVTGWEFEVTANPLPNLRVQASYAIPDAEVVDFFPQSRAHFAENLAQWNAAVNDATKSSSDRDELRAAIANAQNQLDQALPGGTQQGSVKSTASLFANYTFTGEFLRGFSFGTGVSRTGKSFAGTFDGQEAWGSSVVTGSAVLAYEHKFGKINAHFALNIENLYNDRSPIITGYHWGYRDQNGGLVADQFYQQAPRTARLTARFQF